LDEQRPQIRPKRRGREQPRPRLKTGFNVRKLREKDRRQPFRYHLMNCLIYARSRDNLDVFSSVRNEADNGSIWQIEVGGAALGKF
jgi:hypothetical protein